MASQSTSTWQKWEQSYLYTHTYTGTHSPTGLNLKRIQNKSGGKHGLSGWERNEASRQTWGGGGENRAMRFPFKAQNSCRVF